MFLFHLSKEDRQRIHQILKQYQEDSKVQSMHGFVQHGRTSTYEHCMNVVKLSFWLNKHLHLSANERALLAGALLHDFYLYDWHEKSTWHRWHGFSHPSVHGKMQGGIFLWEPKKKILSGAICGR